MKEQILDVLAQRRGDPRCCGGCHIRASSDHILALSPAAPIHSDLPGSVMFHLEYQFWHCFADRSYLLVRVDLLLARRGVFGYGNCILGLKSHPGAYPDRK